MDDNPYESPETEAGQQWRPKPSPSCPAAAWQGAKIGGLLGAAGALLLTVFVGWRWGTLASPKFWSLSLLVFGVLISYGVIVGGSMLGFAAYLRSRSRR